MSGLIPSTIEQYQQGRSAMDLVLGAAYGAYVGLSVERSGLASGSYFDFATFLFMSYLTVFSVNAYGDRLHRGNLKWAFLYLLFSITGAAVTTGYSVRIGVDWQIIGIILVLWICLTLFETASLGLAYIFRKANK